MTPQYLIGVDLGTSATKAALYHLDGRLAGQATLETPLYHPQPGAVEQDCDDFYRTAAQTVRQCIVDSGVDPRQVAAIAFDSQMAGLAAIDEAYRPAARFDSWLDMRCQPYIEALERDYGEKITRLTGCPPTCDHGPKMLWWKEEQPAVYARTAKYLMPAAYVAGAMAGLKAEAAFMDDTFLHFTALSDAQAGAWSGELCSLLGIDPQKLPRIVSPWEVIGETTPAAARDFGLVPGLPIAAGCGDTAAGALGAGIVRPGMLLDTAGTAAVLAACTDLFTADESERALLTMRSVIPGLWHPLAYVAGGGLALRWFRDQFAHSHSSTLTPPSDLYDLLCEEAAQIPPGAEGLFFSPHLGGRVCPASPAMRGVWAGFSWGHTPAHFFRAILESIAFEYAYYLQILRRLLPDLQLLEARAIGGGARSQVWNQIKADVMNVPYQRLQRAEFATWGSALVAGRAVGLFTDLAETAARTTPLAGAPLRPQAERTAFYQPLAERYIRWQARLAHDFSTP